MINYQPLWTIINHNPPVCTLFNQYKQFATVLAILNHCGIMDHHMNYEPKHHRFTWPPWQPGSLTSGESVQSGDPFVARLGHKNASCAWNITMIDPSAASPGHHTHLRLETRLSSSSFMQCSSWLSVAVLGASCSAPAGRCFGVRLGARLSITWLIVLSTLVMLRHQRNEGVPCLQ